jgi:hypothetical protein
MTPVSALLVSILNWQATIRRIIGLNGHEVHKTSFGDGTAERPIVFPTASMRSAGVKQDTGKGSFGKPSVSFDASVQFAGVEGSPRLPGPASARNTSPPRSSSAAAPPSVPWPSSAYPRLPGDRTAERPIVLKQDMGKGSSGNPSISLDASVQSARVASFMNGGARGGAKAAGMPEAVGAKAMYARPLSPTVMRQIVRKELSAAAQRSSTEDLGPPSSLIPQHQQQRQRNVYPAVQYPPIELRPAPLRSGGEALEKVEDLVAEFRKQLKASSVELAQERKQQLEQPRTEFANHQKQQLSEFTHQHQQRADYRQQSPPIELIPLPPRSGPDVVVRLYT